jgi:hypothetical protein
MAKKQDRILAINCTTPEEFRQVFDKLHTAGLRKDGTALFNVFAHTTEFNQGMRFVMMYLNSREVKLAAKADVKNSRIHVITTDAFMKEIL